MLPLVHYIRYENHAQKGKEQNQCCCRINLTKYLTAWISSHVLLISNLFILYY